MYTVKLTKKQKNTLKKWTVKFKAIIKENEKGSRDPEQSESRYDTNFWNVGTYFENCFRIYYTIDKNREIINVETVIHKDET